MTVTAAPVARPPVATRVAATAAWAAFVVGMTVAGVLYQLSHRTVLDGFVVPFTSFATVGWLVAYRRPRNPLGWLFLGIGILTAIGVLSDSVIGLALHRGWSAHGIVMLSAWVQLWFWYPLLVMCTAFTLLLFPNGLPSRRWRVALWGLVGALTAMTVMAALSPQVEFGKAKLPNPIGVASNVKDVEKTTVFQIAGIVLVACLVASVVSLGVRFRRSRGLERAQLKWFFLGASVLGVTVGASIVWPWFDNSPADDVLFPVSLSCLPLSCGLAILRYRLFDIDRIVSRTLSYALVTGLLVGLYVGCIVLSTSLLSFGSSFGVAGSTLVAAAAFQPLRRGVQRRVDRRFDRAAYDARRTVDRFSATLRDEVDVDAVRDDLLTTVAFAVAPSSASLWLVST